MKRKRTTGKLLSFLLTLVMVMGSIPTDVFYSNVSAAEVSGICEHHTEHTAECGYVEAVEGSPCTHVCGDACVTVTGTSCVHVHGQGDCTYVAARQAVYCGHTCSTEVCGFVQAVAEVACGCVPGEDGTLVHAEGCGYVAPVAGVGCGFVHENCGCVSAVSESGSCGHVCSVESGCVTVAQSCTHIAHTADCGYTEAVPGQACTFTADTCELCASENNAASDELPETDTTEDEDTETGSDKTDSEETEDTDIWSDGTEDTETETEESETLVCTCGTDDETIHATDCAAYVAPENPQCFCVEKCTEDTVNVWCDVCGVQGLEACEAKTEQDEATGIYAADTPTRENNRIYGNGVPLYIDAGTTSGNTIVYYLQSGNKVYLTSNGAEGEDMSSARIFGGSKDETTTADISITMNGGTVNRIYGGGCKTSDSSSYIGTQPSQDFLEELMEMICRERGISSIYEAEEGIEITNRKSEKADVIFVINHNKQKSAVDFGQDTLISLLNDEVVSGKVMIDPGDVLILKR